MNKFKKFMLPLQILSVNVSFFSILSEFFQTFCLICQQVSVCLMQRMMLAGSGCYSNH